MFFASLLVLLISQYSCKGSKQTQNGMENVPYIPPIISDNTPPPIIEEEAMPPTPAPPVEETIPPQSPPDKTAPTDEANMLGGYTKERIRFRIQIGAFKTALAENDPFFKIIAGEEVRVERSPDNIYRYSLGWYDDYNRAEIHKSELKAKGFSNAFLVAFGDDDKRINIPIDKVLDWYLK